MIARRYVLDHDVTTEFSKDVMFNLLFSMFCFG